MNIIAITGLKRSGKDLLANHIAKSGEYKHVKISQKLKTLVKTTFNLENDDIESSKKDVVNPTIGVTPRRLMDFFGTQVFQYDLNNIMPHVGRKFWIKDLLSRYENQHIVISDLRFKHEIEEIKKHRCVIIRINRNLIVDNNYVSETEINDLVVDHEILNDTTIKEFINKYERINGNDSLS